MSVDGSILGDATPGAAAPGSGGLLTGGASTVPTFPKVPPPSGVELFHSGAWQDITADVNSLSGIQITRGSSSEGQPDAARMTLELKNSTGTYSPRNPSSPLFGLIGRNTPIRHWVEYGGTRLLQPTVNDFWSAPDSAALSITGDVDVRVEVSLDSWRPEAWVRIGPWKLGQYSLAVEPTGLLMMRWSTDGTASTTASSTAPIPGGITGRKALRATLDVNNGSGGHTVRFYSAASLAGAWTEFGSAVVGAGTTSIFDYAGPISTVITAPGKAYGLEVRNGIGGTVVTSVDWTTQTSGATTVTDAQGNVWTRTGAAELTSRRYRFTGEVSEWPQRWGKTGSVSVRAPIECSGITRRLVQGASPLHSALRRGVTALPGIIAYWPCEDAAGSDVLTPVTSLSPMRIIGQPQLATFDGFSASEPLPVIGTASMLGQVRPANTASGAIQVRFLVKAGAGMVADAVLVRVRTGAGLAWVDIHCSATGEVYAKAYASTGALLVSTTPLPSQLFDKASRVSLELQQTDTSVEVKMVSLEAGEWAGWAVTHTLSAITIGSAGSVEINPARDDLGETTIGHVTVERAITTIFDLAGQLGAHRAERADTRIVRLSAENSVPTTVIGNGGGCERMGWQGRSTLVDLLRDAAESDGGVLAEPRDAYGLVYRTLDSMCSQAPVVQIAYTDNLLLPFEPTDDDSTARNRVSVARDGGSSSTVELAAGAMSVLPPPAGIGVYDEQVTLSLATDAATAQQAGWRLGAGTVDEARWPVIGVNLAHPTFLADQALSGRILDADLGDRIVVTDLPDWLPPVDVDQIIRGYTEAISWDSGADGGATWTIEWTCTPAAPLRAGTFNADADRWGSDGSYLAAPVSSSATSWTVDILRGPAWTTAAGDFPFDALVAGERVTVTGISSATSPQTFTVTRAVNGVVKAHDAGTQVALADWPVWSARPEGTSVPISGADTTGGTGGSGSGGSTAPPPPVIGAPPSGLPWLGAAGPEAADGRFAAQVASRKVPIGGTWVDNKDSQINMWAIRPGFEWGSWNAPLDIAVGAIYLADGETWASAAGGAYDSRWVTSCQNMRTYWGTRDPGLLYVRFAHEMNLSGNPWEVTPGNEANFRTAWGRYRDILRAQVPGAKLVWCPNDGTSSGSLDVRNLYPNSGKEPDVIACDSYNQYPWVDNATDFTNKINLQYGSGAPLGIEKWRQYALSKGKPFALGEWANNGDTGGAGGGGDSPDYVTRFRSWAITNAGSGPGQVLYAVHFNMWNQFQMWPTTIQPNTWAAYKALY